MKTCPPGNHLLLCHRLYFLGHHQSHHHLYMRVLDEIRHHCSSQPSHLLTAGQGPLSNNRAILHFSGSAALQVTELGCIMQQQQQQQKQQQRPYSTDLDCLLRTAGPCLNCFSCLQTNVWNAKYSRAHAEAQQPLTAGLYCYCFRSLVTDTIVPA